MTSIINKCCNWILCNYFLLLIIAQIGRITGIDTKLEIFILIASIIILLYHIKEIKFSSINTYFIFLIFYITCTALINSYRWELKYYSFRYFIWGMLFFFIGQLKIYAHNEFFKSQKYTLFILYITSIYLYFFPPIWYQNWKNTAFSLADQFTIDITNYNNDFSRLSGFWTYPYFVSYSAFIYLVYLLLKCKRGEGDRKTIVFITTAFIAAFFSMMRVVIVCLVLYYLYLLLFYKHKTNSKWKILNISIITIGILGSFYSIYLFNNYISERVYNNNNLIVDRFAMFSNLFKYINIFGLGIGRFSNEAKLYGYPSIMDAEWLKLLCEIGILGVLFLCAFFLIILKKAFKHTRNNIIEISIILFFIITMAGANSLELPIVKHSVFLWFCAGQITNKYREK